MSSTPGDGRQDVLRTAEDQRAQEGAIARAMQSNIDRAPHPIAAAPVTAPDEREDLGLTSDVQQALDDLDFIAPVGHQVYEATEAEPEECTDECTGCMVDRIRAVLLAALAARPAPVVSGGAQAALVAISRWIDAGNADRDPEALHLHRVIKIGEEAGEVIEALIGWLGANPRKGQTHSVTDVIEELLDVAVTALGAVEHLDDHRGHALSMLDDKIRRIAERVGLTEADAPAADDEGGRE